MTDAEIMDAAASALAFAIENRLRGNAMGVLALLRRDPIAIEARDRKRVAYLASPQAEIDQAGPMPGDW